MSCNSCGGCSGCSNCHCEETDVCQENETLSEKLHTKVAFLKDYVCVLGASTCKSIIQRVSKYAFFVWCTLRDMLNVLMAHDKRLDCLENRIDELIEYLKNEATGKVEFGMKSKGTTGDDGYTGTYTKIETSKDGSFVIKWNMIDSGEVGQGRIEGKVNHNYTVEDDGAIKAEIKSITLNKASYTLSGGSTDNDPNAAFSVMDKSGKELWKKSYKVTEAWSENINKTFEINETKTIKANGGSSGDVNVFKTLDDWTAGDTHGDVSVSYTNNGTPFTFDGVRCGRCPEDKVVEPEEEAEGGDADA